MKSVLSIFSISVQITTTTTDSGQSKDSPRSANGRMTSIRRGRSCMEQAACTCANPCRICVRMSINTVSGKRGNALLFAVFVVASLAMDKEHQEKYDVEIRDRSCWTKLGIHVERRGRGGLTVEARRERPGKCHDQVAAELHQPV